MFAGRIGVHPPVRASTDDQVLREVDNGAAQWILDAAQLPVAARRRRLLHHHWCRPPRTPENPGGACPAHHRTRDEPNSR
jgi:hypothetical protein